MKLPLLAAALCAALAAPSHAGQAEIPKFDFTKRPELQPVPSLPEYPDHKEMTNKDAEILKSHLFGLYQNIGSLGRFIRHKRTKDEPPMPAEDLAWATKELAAAKAAADIAQPKAEKALKVGIERLPPLSEETRRLMGDLRFRGLFARAKYAKPAKPTLEFWEMVENDAQAAVMLDLYDLVEQACRRPHDIDEKENAQSVKRLAEDVAELNDARAKIKSWQDEAGENRESDAKKTENARNKINRAASGDLGAQNSSTQAGKDGTTSSPDNANGVTAGGGGQQIDPAEAARRANQTPRHQPIKGKSIVVPNP